ncbi:MAG: UGSC family (seleno)protein [Steroidobacteraceae bacterium]
MTVEYMRPTGRKTTTRDYSEFNLGLPRGKVPQVVGMLASGFPDADKFLLKQADALKRVWPTTRFRFEVKAGADQLNVAIQDPLLSSMAEECDAVIIAWGHCGSCTSGVTRDGILFAERGVPSVTLVCDIFWDYSEWYGGALGVTSLPRVQIPFPTSGTGDANQRQWAEKLVPQIVEQLALRTARPQSAVNLAVASGAAA